jgi:hypothetical protein
MDFDNIIKGEAITTVTCVGYHHDSFPYPSGNCFSVKTSSGGSRIVNFNYENLIELEKRGVITFPIDIIPISENSAVIHDSRIPNEWYDTRFCEVCCPHNLLPIPQQLAYNRKILQGKITEHSVTNDDGTVIKYVRHVIEPVPTRRLNKKWSVELADDIVSLTNDENKQLERDMLSELEKVIMPKMEKGGFYTPYIPIIKKENE